MDLAGSNAETHDNAVLYFRIVVGGRIFAVLSLMFCVGIAAALAKKNKQQAAIIGLMSYFMYLTAGNVTLTQLGMLAEADPMVGLYLSLIHI